MKYILRIALFVALLVTAMNVFSHLAALPKGSAPSYSRPVKETTSWWR